MGRTFSYISVSGAAIALSVPPDVRATDFYSEPWELRFAISMDRQSNYPTTLGRHASLAYPGGDSRNPASDDWLESRRGKPSPSVTLVEAPSQSGALIQAVIGAVSFHAEDVPGTWSLAFARTDTLDSTANLGFHNEIESNEFFVGYSRRLSEKLSWGMQGRLLNADLMRESGLAELGGLAGRVRTGLAGGDVEVGLLGETEAAWTWGITAGLGVSRADSDVFNIVAVPVPVPPFSIPPETQLASTKDDVLASALRFGIGKTWDSAGIYADMHYINVTSELTGSASMARVSIGGEKSLSPIWTVRAGATTDTEHEWSLGAGASYRGGGRIAFDFGYQYNAAPELKPDLGRVHLFSVSAAWAL